MSNSAIKYNPFEVLQVPLEGSNLVQASAGTGKTYSISVLVLRMIIESKIPVNEILMVTFTNAAVAELEERVRHFLLEANRYVLGASTETTEIRHIIDEEIKRTSKEKVHKLISDTLLLLDEIQIFTINSFCQNMLTEYAFETGQLFSSQILSDQTPYLVRFANEYWREKITTLPKSVLGVIADPKRDCLVVHNDKFDGFSKDALDQIITGGNIEINQFDYDQKLDLVQSTDQLLVNIKDYNDAIQKSILAFKYHEEEILQSLKNKGFREKLQSVELDYNQKFTLVFNKYYEKKQVGYISNILDEIKILIEQTFHTKTILNKSIREIQKYLIGEGIEYVLKKMSQYKLDNNLMSFNDSILFLYNALQDPATVNKIHHPYKALFVDEFQDTDLMQYEIFKTLFAEKSIQFFIGDPKQSIYGFRGADLDTYKTAADEIDHHYTMTTNYRSSEILIPAVNDLYSHIEDPFKDEAIQYDVVDQGKDHGILQKGVFISEPISVITYSAADGLIIDVVKEIEAILTEDYFIQKDKKKTKIRPEDIAVLTRDKRTGAKIKALLSKKNIPAVQLAESNIYKSDEALWVSFIFQAILRPTSSNVNRAIFHPATGISQRKLKEVNPEYWIESFNELRKEYAKIGIYPTMMSFLSVFNIRSSIQKSQIEGGDRIIANYYQLVELLHESEKYKSYQGDELLQWLVQQISIEERIQQDDVKAERIESDEDAVQIVTIHKSKGLTYNIVFFVDLNLQTKVDISKVYDYKDVSSKTRYSVKYPDENQMELHKEQSKKEAYRLLYVAITRAVYKIVVFTKKGLAFNNYFNELPNELQSKWTTEIDYEKANEAYIPEQISNLNPPRSFSQSVYDNWGVMSFSSITTHAGVYEKDDIEQNNIAYEDFIFKSWGKGAVHGNFIHDTLEFIDFSNNEKWPRVIKKLSTLYPTVYKEEHEVYYGQFLHHIVNVPLNNEGLKLKDIHLDKRISEMEFYYDLEDVDLKKIKDLVPDIELESRIKTNGIMHGFVDLFFEHEGKYYILDWKSNYLGNHVDAYTSDKLYDAMTVNNYHLQYWVYTIAVRRYLEQNLPDFDYDRDFGGVYYLFVRGMREGQDTGVFFAKPCFDSAHFGFAQ